MADTVTNLKVRFGADTKNFKADLESGKAAVDNFTGQASGAFSQFAEIFGVNMGAVSGQINGVSKSLSLLSSGLKGTTASASVFSAAMKIIKLALISTGVGAIVVAFGALISYFSQTERGAEAIERVMASVKAVFKVVTDQASALGETIVNAFKNPKQTVQELWEFIKSQFVNRITAIPRVIEAAWNLVKGIFNGTMGEAAKEYASALTQLGTGLDKTQQSKVLNYFKAVGKEMGAEAKAAWNLQKALQVLEDREIALIEVQGKRKQQIADLREQAKQEGKTAQERLALLDKVIAIEKQMTADEVLLQKERVRIQEAQLNMGEKMDDDVRALAESKAQLNNIEAEGLNNIRALSRERNKAIKEIDAESEAIMKLRLEQSKDLKPITPLGITASSTPGLETDKLTASADKIKSIYGDLKSTVVDFSSVFQESMAGIAVGFGESLGNMLAGTGTLSDLGNMVISSLADLAIQVGEIAIGVGIATFGIKAALESLNPVLAIAAGVALVALGSAAKSALSKAGGGGGTFSSASTSSYGSGVSSYGSGSSIRSAPMQIVVSGEFKLKNGALVASIDQYNTRRNIGT